MIRFFSILFNGKKPVNVQEVVGAQPVNRQRERLVKELKRAKRGYHVISRESERMKEVIDTALAIATTTGGLK